MLSTFVFPLLASTALALKLSPILDLDNPLVERRAIGDIQLQDVESFLWAAPSGNDLIYANFTVYYPENTEHVLATERFAKKLKSVNCGANKDLTLEFNDQSALDEAKNSWNWVNRNPNNTFVLVTNHKSCSPDEERVPYVIHDIKYDGSVAHLTAELKEWEEVAHSYTLHVGHVPLNNNHRMLMERADFAMNLATSYNKNLFSKTIGAWSTTVDLNLATYGKLNVDFNIDVSLLKIKSASVSIQPAGVGASAELAVGLSGQLTSAFTWQNTIISIPVQGIEIAKIVKLGAFLDVEASFTVSAITGTANAKIGAKADIPDSSLVRVDLVKSSNNAVQGWNPSFSATPFSLTAKVEGSAEAYVKPNVKLEASVLSKGWNVALGIKTPYIKANFAAIFNNAGVCGTTQPFGVDVSTKAGIVATVQAANKGSEASPFWTKELYSKEWDLFTKCLAF
ncbi:hypothetical protein B0J11DRAFT_595533 [Dendryphion nanum]|uniref:Uncharacterized protein n=1 Tax=Dendryphion nanum TaxID=256645 RepID=A0A9P9D6G3_9PLEO|nr:hypothetical protein B0J11DRAFT_595533 [Dendryphion nanum]